jgi:signal transduction histidine kinase
VLQITMTLRNDPLKSGSIDPDRPRVHSFPCIIYAGVRCPSAINARTLMTDLAQRGERREDRRHGARSAPAQGSLPGLYLRIALLPAVAVAVLGIAVAVFLLMSGRTVMTTRIVLVAAAALTALILIAAIGGAAAATRRMQRQLAALRAASSRAQDDLRQLAERAQRGEQPSLAPPPAPADGSDDVTLLVGELLRERHAAQVAVVQAAAQAAAGGNGGGPDQRVEVFVNLARRMQSLVHREIQLLDDLEGQVEDPDLLKGLFTVDHLATRMRRQSESLAVLGGAVSRRQWSRPVTMHEVLRAAVAEVEQYSRVKVVPPVEGTLQGNAVTDVIHLVAELIENATKFSAPHTQAMLRAQNVTAGLVIEVEDRGLGMLAADQQRMNGLLADPGRVDIQELLRDGRIGLFVVATLARRHGIRVQLQSNIYGGIQAVVVLPKSLIEPTPAPRSRAAQGREAQGREAQAREPQRREAPHRETRPSGGDATGPVPSVPRAPAGTGTLPVRQAAAGGLGAASPTFAEQAAQLAPPAQPLPPAHSLPPAQQMPASQPMPSAPLPSAQQLPPTPPAGFPASGASGGSVWAGMTAQDRYASASPNRPARPSTLLPSSSALAGPPPAGPPAASAAPASAAPPATGERPELPRRVGQTHLAPELREPRTQPRDEAADDQIPGLMAAFQRGISRAAEEDRPARTDSPR